MFGLRLPELLIILVVLVLLFGAKKLPELGDSLGKGIRAFKRAAEHGLGDDDADSKEGRGAATKTSASSHTEKAHKGDDGSP